MTKITEIETKKLVAGKINVRKTPGDVSDLASSIVQVGILEPLIVRPFGKNFEVIAGTRRLAAARKIKLEKVPCIVREMDDDAALIASLAENVQRGDLDDEEIAEAYFILRERDESKWTKIEFSKKLGKSSGWLNSTLTAYEALLKLRESGMKVSMKTNPEKNERENGAISVSHLSEVEIALRSKEVRAAIPEDEIDAKRVELVESVRDMPRMDAIVVVYRFRKNPERSVKSIKDQYVGTQTGVRLDKTYLPPEVVSKLDEIAESRQTTMEEVLPEIVERGLNDDSEPNQEVEKEYTSEMEGESQVRNEPSYSEQYHQQRMWNLKQLVDITDLEVFTVGFSQKNVESLMQELQLAGVKLLIDARKNPYSQYKYEFNKDSLTKSLSDVNILYEHMEELGVSKSLRNQLYHNSITMDDFFDIYDREILTDKSIDTLLNRIEKHGRIAILCTEISPTLCHRHRIASALNNKGKTTFDL